MMLSKQLALDATKQLVCRIGAVDRQEYNKPQLEATLHDRRQSNIQLALLQPLRWSKHHVNATMA